MSDAALWRRHKQVWSKKTGQCSRCEARGSDSMYWGLWREW